MIFVDYDRYTQKLVALTHIDPTRNVTVVNLFSYSDFDIKMETLVVLLLNHSRYGRESSRIVLCCLETQTSTI